MSRWTVFRITLDGRELAVEASRPNPFTAEVTIDHVRDVATGADVPLADEQMAAVRRMAVAALVPAVVSEGQRRSMYGGGLARGSDFRRRR